jgi:hypothetical protein
MPNEDITHFTAVDQTRDPAFFARFLDEGNQLPAIGTARSAVGYPICFSNTGWSTCRSPTTLARVSREGTFLYGFTVFIVARTKH